MQKMRCSFLAYYLTHFVTAVLWQRAVPNRLFRPNLRPYDPNEIELIEEFNNMAAKEGR